MNKKKKIIASIIAAIIAIIVIAVIVVAMLMDSVVKKPFNTSNSINFSVNSGEGLSGIIDDLSSKGVIKDPLLTKLYIRLDHPKVNLTPGDYTVKGDVSFDQFIHVLNTGTEIKVVIPEGYTIDQIATKLAGFGLCTESQFISAVENYPLPSYIKKRDGVRYQLEGYLFPTTYNFKKGESPDAMIQNMLNMFTVELNQAMAQTGVKITPDQIETLVTKASVVQAEGKTPKDMELVSSVIDNRIKANMPLQMDATVIYALGKHIDKVYYKDLQVNSPYNTYLHKGLPVGPICNPGLEALKAALKPASTDYLYYILNGNTAYFTNNYQDFLTKKSELLS